MNLQQIREELTDLLQGLSANVYWFPPVAPIAPAVVVVPGSPNYIDPVVIGLSKFRIYFNITFLVNMQDNQAALNNMEELLFDVYDALPATYVVGSATQPTPIKLNNTDYLSADIPVQVVIDLGN